MEGLSDGTYGPVADMNRPTLGGVSVYMRAPLLLRTTCDRSLGRLLGASYGRAGSLSLAWFLARRLAPRISEVDEEWRYGVDRSGAGVHARQ